MRKGKTKITTAEGDEIIFPKPFVFTKEDWEDLYKTLSSFKARVMLRHKAAADLQAKESNEKGQKEKIQ